MKNSYFTQRLAFVSFGICISLPLLIFYTAPFINVYTGDFSELYNEVRNLESRSDNIQGNPESVHQASVYNSAIKGYFLFALFTNFLVLAIAIFLSTQVPKIAIAIRKWKQTFFVEQNWTIFHRPVIDFTAYSKIFSPVVFTLWLAISAVLYVLIYNAFGILELIFFDNNYIFKTDIGKKFFLDSIAITKFFLSPLITESWATTCARIIMFAYIFPLMAIVIGVIKKRTINFRNFLKEFRYYSLRNAEHSVNKLSEEISKYIGVKKPKIIILPQKMPLIAVKYIGIPFFQSYLVISEGCMVFNYSELGGLLAHEIYHVKRHNFKWYLLNLLSDYTLFGTGFLAILTNSYQYELEADFRAAQWAKEKGCIDDFINALRIVNMTGFRKRGDSNATSNVGHDEHIGNFQTTKEKLRYIIGMIFKLYFGEEIISYIHPPIEERIEKIRAITII